MEMREELVQRTREVEQIVEKFLPEEEGYQKTVLEAMNYSVRAGGKRLRPMLMQETYRLFGGSGEEIEPFMAAIEMIHTSSLIHDDLPCMDNDQLRRGLPTAWVKFGYDMAVLAGDALLIYAVETAAKAFSMTEHADRVGRSIGLLAEKTGIYGMIGGQVIDLIYEKENPTVKQLLNVYRMKTGALISAACLMGCISAGADEEKMSAASKFAYSLGIAFQIQDDILDIVGDEKELGKPVGSDAENEKITYAALVGIEKAKSDVKKLTNAAVNQLDIFENSDFLKALALSLVNRKK